MPSRSQGLLANRASLRGAKPALWIAALLTLAALAGLGTSLHSSQTKARRTIEDRFAERARISASLMDSLFASSAGASQARNAQRFGSAHVTSAALGAEAKRGRLTSLVLLRENGTIMARSPRTPAAVIRAIEAKPAFVRAALKGNSLALGDVISLPDGTDTIQFAQPFVTPQGRRLLVSGVGPRVLHGFIGHYLAEIPDRTGGSAYLLDGRGALVAGASGVEKRLLPAAERGLSTATAGASQGAVGSGRWFAAHSLKNSHWRVVLTAREKTLFQSVTGEGRWVPWPLFAAFGPSPPRRSCSWLASCAAPLRCTSAKSATRSPSRAPTTASETVIS